MPVTFHPSDQKLSSFSEHRLNHLAAKDALSFLSGTVHPELSDNVKELFQSSFGDLEKSGEKVLPQSNGFVHAAIQAHNQHHHLIIRPDDVWITILSQFNLFVNANAEELRHLFVDHEGKKELKITSVGNRYSVNFGNMAEQMSHLIQKNVLDSSLREWIMPDFTTTTANDRVVASVVMTATLKAYFSYLFNLCCGLPAVTLLGEKRDWMKILEKIEKLPAFGKETSQWHTLLKPVLSRFVAAFDQPESQENKNFWQNVAHHSDGGSGPIYISGWITAFMFFSNKGKPMNDRQEGTVLDGVQYHTIDSTDIPPAYAEVNVTLDDNGQEFKTIMVAGVVGYSVTDSGKVEGEHSRKRDTLQPVSGWWLFEEKGTELESICESAPIMKEENQISWKFWKLFWSGAMYLMMLTG